MEKKFKYGLIGCGNCGENKHLASYKKFPDEVEPAAVFDVDMGKAKALAEKYDIPKVYSSYEELLADQTIDVVSIVTSNVTHAAIAIAALNAGKHVHLEKPIAINALEAQRIVDAKNHSGKLLMIGLNNRFTNAALFAKRYIDEGHLGSIYHARCGWTRRAGCNVAGTWFADKELSGGGPLIDLGVHYFDLTLYLMGFPDPVSVSASCYDKIANPLKGQEVAGSVMLGKNKVQPGAKYTVEDLATGFVKLDGGASVSFEFSWASHIERETCFTELLGTKGGISIRDWGKSIKIFTETAGNIIDIVPQTIDDSGWGENETRYFIDCIKTEKTPLAKPEEAVKMMLIIDAIYASSSLGGEIKITKQERI
ncbi:MAG: putative oxidoreductase YcjS [Smithella sp. PtaU1.Bin162]|nr:MAG: putative oxidoreductase YcjS [Smithella sp. PtaU1.Bin162]